MISELIVGKITLESIKYFLQKEAKEEDIYPYNTLGLLSVLSDITTCGIAYWTINRVGDSMIYQAQFEVERDKERKREKRKREMREILEKLKTETEKKTEMLEELKTLTIRGSV